MTFPNTRLTLIQRIAAGGNNADWRQFFEDYWRPVFRFSSRWGRLRVEDAEDITSSTFEILLCGDMLSVWVSRRHARLRTLLCAIVRNLLANHGRKEQRRAQLVLENLDLLAHLSDTVESASGAASSETQDAFFVAWAEEQLETAMELLLAEFHEQGRGDDFRILHGRLCEGLTIPQIAAELSQAVTLIENRFRRARQRLKDLLQRQVRLNVERYTAPADCSAEFNHEWQQLGAFLTARSGIEGALQQARADFDPLQLQRRQLQSLAKLAPQRPAAQ